MDTSAGGLPASGEVRIGEDDGRAALLVDGVVQSISPRDGAERGGYWAAMLPPVRPARALILGFGGGTIAALLRQRFGSAGLRIVGVDDDPRVLETARAAGWLEGVVAPSPPGPLSPRGEGEGMEVLVGDAFGYVQTCRETFDYVALDLYRGPLFVGQSLTKPFLRRLRALLAPRGWLAVNLFVDERTAGRVERIRRMFAVERQERVGSNVIVHARRS